MDTEENVYFYERDEKDYRWMNKAFEIPLWK